MRALGFPPYLHLFHIYSKFIPKHIIIFLFLNFKSFLYLCYSQFNGGEAWDVECWGDAGEACTVQFGHTDGVLLQGVGHLSVNWLQFLAVTTPRSIKLSRKWHGGNLHCTLTTNHLYYCLTYSVLNVPKRVFNHFLYSEYIAIMKLNGRFSYLN